MNRLGYDIWYNTAYFMSNFAEKEGGLTPYPTPIPVPTPNGMQIQCRTLKHIVYD